VELEIVLVYENLDGYILKLEKQHENYEELWNKYAIQPYWKRISQWAPFDMSERKPKPIKDIDKLKQQVKSLKEININAIKSEFMNVVAALPSYDDDDTIVVAIYPLDDENTIVKERQNGVVGACVFGNILINVNPFARDHLKWIPYVFAHEYHHCVWGSYWHGIRQKACTGSLLEAMLSDGQADAFAKSLYPTLSPTWIHQIPKGIERELWDKHYSKSLNEIDYDYCKYMFGNDEAGIPWCAGYFFGVKSLIVTEDVIKKLGSKI
jgi:uncharacterized protein YjaZ